MGLARRASAPTEAFVRPGSAPPRPSATRSRVVPRSGHPHPCPADATSDGVAIPRLGSDLRSGVARLRPMDLGDPRRMQAPLMHPDDVPYKEKEVTGCEHRRSWHGPSTCCTPARLSPPSCLQPPPDGSLPAGSSRRPGLREESHDAFPPYRVRADLAGRSRHLSGRGLEAWERVVQPVHGARIRPWRSRGRFPFPGKQLRVQEPLKEPIPQP